MKQKFVCMAYSLKKCMYRVLGKKLENISIIGSSYMNQNQF